MHNGLINNNLNLRSINTQSWRNIIGVVPQDITIFSGNVISNILVNEKDNPENIIQFFNNYGFDSFIKELPQGYATILGDTGINLSGGQKQIIGLMRVLYKKPQLLILDEFTSAMDRKTEQFVLQTIQKLKKHVAIIFISHRLHSLKQIADTIYILENGETELAGSHLDLLKTSNFYSNFWKDLSLSNKIL